MKFGYTRASSQSPDSEAQTAALQKAGCELLFHEKSSGGRWSRPELHRLLGQLRSGDVLMVSQLDCPAHSLNDLIILIEKIEAIGASFKSLAEAIDTSSPGGRMMIQLIQSFAKFERAKLSERTKLGMETARQQGRNGGRPSKLTLEEREEILQLIRSGKQSAADIAKRFKVHPATISRLLKQPSDSTHPATLSPTSK
jgi:DNA invertase Pin-like site-specific DNA recombinase